MPPLESNIVIRTNSRRCRNKVRDQLDREPQYYWTWEDGAVFAEVTPEEYERIKAIKGVTKARVDRARLGKCWPAEVTLGLGNR